MNDKRITSGDVIEALKIRFCPPSFAFLEQVADGTGARQYRWADAVAMSVWPSRGYDIHGIEVKVSRYDFLNELNKPAKAEAIQKYCNRWWMAVGDEKIVQAGELPPTWGLLALQGGKMKCIVDAPRLEPAPLSVQFVASVLRNMAASDDSKIEAAHRKGHSEGREAAEKSNYYRQKFEDLKKAVSEFEDKSGFKIESWDAGNIGEAVKLVTQMRWDVEALQRATRAAQNISNLLDEVVKLTLERATA